jgi:uracil-DNA glycosylase
MTDPQPTGTTSLTNPDRELCALQAEIRACRRCVDSGFIADANPVFRGRVGHRLMVVGQAPGERGHLNSVPYAGATGKTLRAWLARAGFAEDALYERFYLTSVTKCFPGASDTGKGDRSPSAKEVRLCHDHLAREIALVRPEIVLALGRLSIAWLLGAQTLDATVGTIHQTERAGHRLMVLPLPHPSGVSHWLNAPENRVKLDDALLQLNALRIKHGW